MPFLQGILVRGGFLERRPGEKKSTVLVAQSHCNLKWSVDLPDRSGCDGVDPDAPGQELVAQASDHGHLGALRHGVIKQGSWRGR